MKIICQGCGTEAKPQNDLVLDGSDDMYSCPICKERYIHISEITECSLPLALEE